MIARIAIVVNATAGRKQQRRRRRCAHEAINIAPMHDGSAAHTLAHDGSVRKQCATNAHFLPPPHDGSSGVCTATAWEGRTLAAATAKSPGGGGAGVQYTRERIACLTPTYPTACLLERHVNLSWPQGYSQAQASLGSRSRARGDGVVSIKQLASRHRLKTNGKRTGANKKHGVQAGWDLRR
jgi:hypothetical protein